MMCEKEKESTFGRVETDIKVISRKISKMEMDNIGGPKGITILENMLMTNATGKVNLFIKARTYMKANSLITNDMDSESIHMRKADHMKDSIWMTKEMVWERKLSMDR